MVLFKFDNNQYSNQFSSHGYVHIQNGVSPNFIDYAVAYYEKMLKGDDSHHSDFYFKEKKKQYLFDFPDKFDLEKDLLYPIADLCGLNKQKMVLCERHLKAYESNADPDPEPHKDRLGSEIAIAIPLVVPEGSGLFLYPSVHTETNPYNSTLEWRDSLTKEQMPLVVLRNCERKIIDITVGDVAMFRGSSIFHERLNAADTVVLYFKVNSFGIDHLCEDPRTDLRLKNSINIISSIDKTQLLQYKIELSPILERINRHYTRLDWQEIATIQVGKSRKVKISEIDFQVLINLKAVVNVGEFIEIIQTKVADKEQLLSSIKFLILNQALIVEN